MNGKKLPLNESTFFFFCNKDVDEYMFFFSLQISSIIEKGEENCTALIDAHKDCMRSLGFKI